MASNWRYVTNRSYRSYGSFSFMSSPVSRPVYRRFYPVSRTVYRRFNPVSRPVYRRFYPVSRTVYRRFYPVSRTVYRRFYPVSRTVYRRFNPVATPVYRRFYPVSRTVYRRFYPASGNGTQIQLVRQTEYIKKKILMKKQTNKQKNNENTVTNIQLMNCLCRWRFSTDGKLLHFCRFMVSRHTHTHTHTHTHKEHF